LELFSLTDKAGPGLSGGNVDRLVFTEVLSAA